MMWWVDGWGWFELVRQQPQSILSVQYAQLDACHKANGPGPRAPGPWCTSRLQEALQLTMDDVYVP